MITQPLSNIINKESSLTPNKQTVYKSTPTSVDQLEPLIQRYPDIEDLFENVYVNLYQHSEDEIVCFVYGHILVAVEPVKFLKLFNVGHKLGVNMDLQIELDHDIEITKDKLNSNKQVILKDLTQGNIIWYDNKQSAIRHTNELNLIIQEISKINPKFKQGVFTSVSLNDAIDRMYDRVTA